jgi:Spy/CpxP family protein refolding chaperone
MTEQSNPAAGGRRRRRWPAIVAVAVVAAFTGAAATGAVGQWAPGWGHHGFMRGPLSPAQIEEHVDRGIRHAAIELDATPEQLEKQRALAKAAVRDLVPMGEKAKAAREKAVQLLLQPNIDRAAIEAFRADQVGLADAASRRLAQAVGDIAEVLTPEQRQKAHELMQWRRGHWRRWHRG